MSFSNLNYREYLRKFVGLSREDVVKLHDLNLRAYNQLLPFYSKLETKGCSLDDVNRTLSAEILAGLTKNIKEQEIIYNKLRKEIFPDILTETHVFPSGASYKAIEELFWGVLNEHYEKKGKSAKNKA